MRPVLLFLLAILLTGLSGTALAQEGEHLGALRLDPYAEYRLKNYYLPKKRCPGNHSAADAALQSRCRYLLRQQEGEQLLRASK